MVWTRKYTVIYPQNASKLPVFLHQYGQESQAHKTDSVNERVAGYGAFTVFVSMAERFPYLFDAVIPVYGVADFGHHETDSWYPIVLKNSPTWSVINNMNTQIGDWATFRETCYLVRNSVLGAKNNKYAHYEILHDVDDGVNRAGVQVELSQRYVAELQKLGYANYNYTETPKTGFVYPSDPRFSSSLWGQPIRYHHGFWDPNNTSLYEFELNTLRPNMLSGTWKRPAFETTGEFFVPSLGLVHRMGEGHHHRRELRE